MCERIPTKTEKKRLKTYQKILESFQGKYFCKIRGKMGFQFQVFPIYSYQIQLLMRGKFLEW